MNHNKPYVVTDDLAIVFAQYGAQGILSPSQESLKSASRRIETSLKSIFPHVQIVPAERIASYLNDTINRNCMPVVSLTGLIPEDIVAASFYFSRSVSVTDMGAGDFCFSDASTWPRHEKYGSVMQQFNNVTGSLSGIQEVALAEDVVFSGGTIQKVIDNLKENSIHVRKVFSSIMLEQARNKLNDMGIETEADFYYDDVIDEVCMRDFILGAPDGGRNVIIDSRPAACAPYIAPFGDVEGWASIPGCHAADFSSGAVAISRGLWSDIEEINGRPMIADDLIKPVLFWNKGERLIDNMDTITKTGKINARYAHTL